ncbi:MAG TPA: hypothetical protein VL614_15245 [Acetobacteraceae bacterium]|jgi:hypothetical protein|nr:hypothetical protein [Acetobacteraceae bacterium]
MTRKITRIICKLAIGYIAQGWVAATFPAAPILCELATTFAVIAIIDWGTRGT